MSDRATVLGMDKSIKSIIIALAVIFGSLASAGQASAGQPVVGSKADCTFLSQSEPTTYAVTE